MAEDFAIFGEVELELLVAVNTNEVGWGKTKHIVAEQEEHNVWTKIKI